MAGADSMRPARRGLPLRLADVVLMIMGASGAIVMLVAGRWAPGFWRSFIAFTLIGLGPLVLRTLPRLIPRWTKLFDALAAFWLLPAAITGHGALGPLVDSLNPVLMDRQLASIDRAMFGMVPSLFFDGRTPAWVSEALLICYYSYFLWPVVVGALLYLGGRRKEYDEYLLALSLSYTAGFFFYVLVPAVGPRFFLAEQFSGPIQGLWLTPLLDSAMRQPRFMRDCFPSGHTAVTLLMLTFAYRHHRRFFWAVLPVAMGLIAGTVVGRFHYLIDIMLAVPFALGVLAATAALSRARPRGVVVLQLPSGPLRRPLRA